MSILQLQTCECKCLEKINCITTQLNRWENHPMLSKPYFLYIVLPAPTAYAKRYVQPK